MKKKIYLTLLTVIMACSLFGCGKEKGKDTTTTTEEKVNANVENKVETKNIEESN